MLISCKITQKSKAASQFQNFVCQVSTLVETWLKLGPRTGQSWNTAKVNVQDKVPREATDTAPAARWVCSIIDMLSTLGLTLNVNPILK